MSENFLISDALKDRVTKESLYTDALRPECHIISISIDENLVSLSFTAGEDYNLSRYFELDSIVIGNKVYNFNKKLKFNLKSCRVDSHLKNIFYTIVIDEKTFWSALENE